MPNCMDRIKNRTKKMTNDIEPVNVETIRRLKVQILTLRTEPKSPSINKKIRELANGIHFLKMSYKEWLNKERENDKREMNRFRTKIYTQRLKYKAKNEI